MPHMSGRRGDHDSERGNVSRAEFPDVVAKFARILIATLTNNVTATAKISS